MDTVSSQRAVTNNNTSRNNCTYFLTTVTVLITRRTILIVLYFLTFATIFLIVYLFENDYVRPSIFYKNLQTSAVTEFTRFRNNQQGPGDIAPTKKRNNRQGQGNLTQNMRKTRLAEFQVIADSGGYGYSAYVDDRPTRDIPTGTGPVVRVFAFILNSVNPRVNWRCIFHFPGHPRLGLVMPIPAVTQLYRFSELKNYEIVMLVCSLPPHAPYQSPHQVSVVTTDDLLKNSQESTSCGEIDQDLLDVPLNGMKLDWTCLWTTLNLISVTDIRKERYVNKENSAVSNFTICVSPMYGRNYDWQDMLKFIEINRILGANKFIFYVDSSVRKSLTAFLRRYSTDVKRDNIVEVHPFNLHLSGDFHLTRFGQTIAINDCLYRTMYRTHYMISQDIDELIVPMRNKTWSDLVEHLNTTYSQKNFAVASFRNVWIPLEYPNDPVYGNDSPAVRYNITQLLKNTRDSFIDQPNSRSKVMLRPEVVLLLRIHHVGRVDISDPNTNSIIIVSPTDALLFHYRKIHAFGNTTIPSLRLREHADIIQERVLSQMKYFTENELVNNQI